MRIRRYLVAIALGLAACREPSTGPEATATTAEITRDVAAQFQTDSLAYTLSPVSEGYMGQIGVTFVNRTGATVYFVNCAGATGLSLEKFAVRRSHLQSLRDCRAAAVAVQARMLRFPVTA